MSVKYSPEEFQAIVQSGDRTDSGMYYDWGYSGPDGAWFILIREPRHTDDDVARAKAELRRDRDVTSLTVARFDGGKQ